MMNSLNDDRAAVREARRRRDAADEALYASQNRLRAKQEGLARALRLGEAGANEAARLREEIAGLQKAVGANGEALARATAELRDAVLQFPGLADPQTLIERLDDRLPFLLFPLRLETRFMTRGDGRKELWVRVFPDEIAVHTHEKTLTPDEVASGKSYWIEI